MFLIPGQAGLAALLNTPTQFIQTLGSVVVEKIESLIQILVSAATLGQAMTMSLITVLTPLGITAGELTLAIGTVVVTAVALGADRAPVKDPHANTRDVFGLKILSVTVGGVSALRAAG
ncbi:MAG: hypothetical protein QOK28_3386 [Actinomycetota bacterium]